MIISICSVLRSLKSWFPAGNRKYTLLSLSFDCGLIPNLPSIKILKVTGQSLQNT
jgi:hypothetical protein